MDHFFITYVIIGITVLFSLKGFSDDYFRDKYLYKPYNVKHYREYYRIFSHVFLHADPMHLIFNMITFFFFGRNLEAIFLLKYGFMVGSLVFIGFFILASFFATMIQYGRHKDHEFYRSLGASGAVSAVLFAFIVLFPKETITFFIIPMPAILFGVLYLGFEFWADKNGKGNIAHDAHISGALFGIVFILITNIEGVKNAFNTLF
ncbi:MAG TPA: rhomboid family intramembrane serine protease [Fluviicola sp.]|nr:rhomboid family intramembrane serine protease [Fluviicola sp.]